MVMHNFVTNNVIHDKPLSITKSFRFIKNLRYTRVAGIISIFVFFLLALDFAFPLVISDNTVEGVGTVSNTSLTLTTDHKQAKLNIVPTSTSGSFATSTDAEKAKFTVATNNSTGYTLAIKGSSNNKLSNTAASTTLDSITTASTGIDAATFNTNTSYLNKWGYLPSKYNSQSNTTKYYGITSSDVTINETTAANASGTSDSYSIGLGAKVDYNKPAGSYTNTFVLAAVGNPVNYTIKYSNGGISGISGIPAEQSGESGDTKIALSTATPTRTGYTFRGWCEGTINTTGNPGTTCSTNLVYSAGQSVSFIDQVSTSTTNTLNLYAVWEPGVSNITLDPNGGSGGTASTTVKYGNTTLDGPITNPTRASQTNTYSISGFTLSGDASGASIGWTSTCTSASDCKSTTTTTYTLNGWYRESGSTNKIATSATAPALQANTIYTNGSSQWAYTSGVTLYAGWTPSTTSPNSITLPTISKTGYTCGWKDNNGQNYTSGQPDVMPTSNLTLYGVCTVNTYRLTIDYGSGVNIVRVKTATGQNAGTYISSPYSMQVFGLTYNTTYYLYPSFDPGFTLDYWTKTGDAGTISSETEYNPGFTIGAGDNTVSITARYSIQGFTLSQCSSLASSSDYTLIDIRDRKRYTVRYINGTCWMTRNLDLPGGTTLTSSNSNVTSDYTLPPSSTSGFDSDQTPYVYNSGSTTCADSSPCYSYYSYAAATAGTGTSITSGDAPSDICPRGWRLPTKDELTTLKTSYNTGTALTASPFLGVYGGDYSNSHFYNGGRGYYWSSTVNQHGYHLDFNSSATSVNTYNQYSGYSVRCVAKTQED